MAAKIVGDTKNLCEVMQREAFLLAARMDGADVRAFYLDLGDGQWKPIPQAPEKKGKGV